MGEAEAYLASAEFERALARDDGAAAKRHLAAGRPIYYGDPQYPDDVIREFPDGRRQLVAISGGVVTVIRQL